MNTRKYDIFLLITIYCMVMISCVDKKNSDDAKEADIYYANYDSQISMISNYLNYQLNHYPTFPEDTVNPIIEDMIDDPDGLMELAGNDQPLIIVDTFRIENPMFDETKNEYTFDVVYPKSFMCTVELELVKNNADYKQKVTLREGRILIENNLLIPTGKTHFIKFISTQLSEEFEKSKIQEVIKTINENL